MWETVLWAVTSSKEGSPHIRLSRILYRSDNNHLFGDCLTDPARIPPPYIRTRPGLAACSSHGDSFGFREIYLITQSSGNKLSAQEINLVFRK